MAKPFVDPIDEEADAAEASVVKNRAGELAERIGKAREDETEEIEVQEPDDDDEAEEREAKTRAEKRSERGRNRVSARERAAAAEARAQALQEQLDAQRSQTRQVAPQVDDGAVAAAEKRYDAIVAEQERLFHEYQRAQNLTPAQEADFQRRAKELDFRKTNAAVDIREAHNAPRRVAEEHKRAMAARAPDVYGNQAALAYAAGEYQKRLAMGEKDSIELHDLVMEEARQVILGKRPPPDASQRARATGMSNGARAPIGAQQPVRLSMPKGSPMYRMALAAYPNDEPGVACQKWANKHGKRFNEEAAKRTG